MKNVIRKRWLLSGNYLKLMLGKSGEPREVNMSDSYIEGLKASGLKIGDVVRVTRAAKTQESGWNNSWMTPQMNGFIGKEYTIDYISERSGIRFKEDSRYLFPYFILEPITTDRLTDILNLSFDGNDLSIIDSHTRIRKFILRKTIPKVQRLEAFRYLQKEGMGNHDDITQEMLDEYIFLNECQY
jgi:hypothetical protein